MLVEGIADCRADLVETFPELTQIALIERNGIRCVDWRQPMRTWLDDLAAGASRSEIATRFHRFLAAAISEMARVTDHSNVILSGGVFQNKALTELSTSLTRKRGLNTLCHRRVPPNDGGLAVGQLAYQLYGMEN